ncbi:MAG TPA: GNAT family N-acetyltransferase [Candidatus Baltobacteraceae bacterium]|jgi:ribosomal-protein-alanine N-acetyltransferase|nr:GNAT family N-acetyltransferase [Candidatus Baltobacteraceae bacterium]
MRLLRTARLRLVPVTIERAPALWDILQKPDLRTYQDLPNVGAAMFAEMVRKRPRTLHQGAVGRFEWLVHVARVRKPIGWVSLRIAERDVYAGEVGYSIVREFRGRGFATEALRMLIAEAFERGGLSRLTAYCVPENAASRQVLKNTGFSYEGILPHGATVNGQPVDVLMHRLDRETWVQSGNSTVIPASAYPA